MSSKSFVLAYCIDNKNAAVKLEKELGKAGIRFKHLSCDVGKNNSFSKEILKQKGNVFVLISDNFLQSSMCMYDGLEMLNHRSDSFSCTPIIIDGEYYNETTSSFQSYPTEFSKVSDLIKYMNHWQEHYLKLRKSKSNIPKNQENAFNKDLKRVRSISAEIGEFLRVLKDSGYWRIEDLENNDYKSFFNKIGKQELIIKLKNIIDNGEVSESLVPKGDVAAPTRQISPKTNIVIPKENKELTEKEKKNKEAYKILVDIFDEDQSPEDKTNEEEKVALDQLDDVSTWKEIMAGFDQDPSNDRVGFSNIIGHLLNNDDDHLAKKQLELYIKQTPDDPIAYLWMARMSINEEDFLQAKKHYEQSIKLDSKNPDALTQLGQLIFHHFSDQYEAAEQLFKKAIDIDPNHVDANYFYAILLTEVSGKPDKAVKYFKRTLSAKPNHRFAYYDLAFLYYNKNDQEKAAKYYEKAFHNNPELRTDENDTAFWYTAYLESKAEVKSQKKKSKKLNTTTANKTKKTPKKKKATKKPSPKTVLITGATSGIGKATADIFAKNGYRLILTGRRADRLEELQENYKTAYKTDVCTLNFDVRNWEATKEQIESLAAKWQNVDLLINNAGLAKGYAPVHEGDLDHWETMIDTNIKGLLYMTKLITPGMVKRQQGQIINICSSAGHEVYPNGNVYCATKHAVDALTKGLRLELHKHNIRVCQVSPGHVEETEFAAVRFDGDLEKAAIYNDFQPLKSSDVAETIYFITTRPAHVTVQDVIMMSTQQASSNLIDRSGRK